MVGVGGGDTLPQFGDELLQAVLLAVDGEGSAVVGALQVCVDGGVCALLLCELCNEDMPHAVAL